MTMTIIPLGVNGYMPSYGRQTTSLLVLSGDQAVILDAGTGLARLLQPEIASRLDGRQVHILLSHYHLDHIIGLFYLPGFWSRWPVHLYAPEAFLHGTSLSALMKKWLEPPFSSDFEPPAIETYFDLHPVRSERFTIGEMPIQVREQKHLGGSLAFRLGEALVFATDTTYDQETAAFARGARVLFHDIYLGVRVLPPGSHDGLAHATLPQALDLAGRAGVSLFAPVHYHPTWTPGELSRLQAKVSAARPPVLWLEEGAPFEVDLA